jgi:hypothetical protein
MTTPTSRSLQLLRESGYIVAIVEHWNPWARIRQDLYGIGDLLAMTQDQLLMVQTTSGGNVSSRLRKAEALPALRLWLRCPTRRFQVIGWAKRGARGKPKKWTARTVEGRLDEHGAIVWAEVV